MSLYGLIGYPLSHSYSSDFFQDYFIKNRIQDEYRPFEIHTLEELDHLIKAEAGLVGFNVTIPFKEGILDLLSDLTTTAKKVGAVNTVFIKRRNKEYKLIGHNTDKDGFLNSLGPLADCHKNALILGCGGASNAVMTALSECGILSLRACRHPKTSKDIHLSDIDRGLIQSHSLIINATPLGMFPNSQEYPSIPYEYISEKHFLYDLIYNPAQTTFIEKGRKQGATYMNGLDMLHKQALLSYAWWNKMK